MKANREVIDRILGAVQAARERGRTIQQGSWGVTYHWDPDNTPRYAVCEAGCCAMGAVLDDQERVAYNVSEDAARLLGVEEDWVLGFTCGFDQDPVSENAFLPECLPSLKAGRDAGDYVRWVLGFHPEIPRLTEEEPSDGDF